MLSLLKTNALPIEFVGDRYWRGTLYIFTNNSKLRNYINSHIDFNDHTINISGLKYVSRPWSPSEKFMLNLALHLYNERNKMNLSDIDYLDSNNRQIALQAIKLRFDMG